MRSLLRACAVVFAPVVVGLGLATAVPAFAATAAGTAISNTATATYSDGTSTYNSQSNTVTTTVQNAPSLTISPPSTSPGSNTVSPGGPMTDNYTLTNTGNGQGYFALTGVQNTDDGVTAGQGTFVTYTVSGTAANGHTLTGSFASIAALNTYLSSGDTGSTPFLIATGATIQIGVSYTANAGASGTITTKLTPDITQPAGSGTTQQTSLTVVGQYNDNVVSDARLDLQKLAVVGGTAAAPTVQYTVRVNNGGGRNVVAVNRAGLPAGSGITGAGVIVTDKLPSYNATQLTLNGSPSFVTQPTGAVFIYSTDGTTWTTTQTGAVYIGVFIPSSAITGSFGASNPGSSQGSVTAAQAQLAFTFTINGSTAAGAANPNAITNVVNSIYADQTGYIEGPGITFQSVQNNGSATPAQTAPAIANTNGTLTGAAQATSACSPVASSVLNGPNGFPGATGPDTTTNTDYTAVSYTNGGTILSGVNGATVSVPSGAAANTFTNSLQNTGNKDDTYTLSAATGTGLTALPAGWTVTFQSAGQTASGSCAAVTAGTVITTVCVPSGATQNYRVIYTPPAGATTFNSYTPYGDAITATSGNDNTKSNITLDEIFVGGFVKLTKSLSVALGQPCASATTFTPGSASVNPGDCVQYTITYLNVAPSGGTNDVTLNATSFVITEDGTASGGSGGTAYVNNWFTNTNGLFAAPVDSNGGTLGGYNPGPGAVGSSKFTDTIGALAAGATGTCTFKVQVK
ncbi:MAG: hypothetical protein JO103_08245 [Candidatus Eremiobacteraeota bacterium]|nr:hypothetical protein [Candidatus Eremiobacteraeota bacterium]MBV9409035.1 hypothetical protein [Candidatus Eremiobacteraeota bacterium]